MNAGPLVYILGDVHLVDGAGDLGEFLDRLARLPPARLVILGDLVEYWLESSASVDRYRPALDRLRALRDAGWRLDLVLGNRELAAGRRFAAASGCRLHWPKLDLAVGSARIRVVHGDRLCHDPGYHLFSAWMRSFWQRAVQAALPPAAQELIAQRLRAASRAKQRRRAAAGAVPARRRVFIDPRRVAGAARGCDVLVAGHIHESWRRRVGGVDLILVGDWPSGEGRWVEGFADGNLRRCHERFARMLKELPAGVRGTQSPETGCP